MAAVAITRTDLSAAELRTSAARMKDARAVRRTLAIALVLDGTSRAGRRRHPAWIARPCGTGCIATTPADWMGSAISGPRDRSRVDADKEQALIGWVELGRIWRGTAWSLAARRPAGPRPAWVWGDGARADRRQVAGPTRLLPPVRAPAASQVDLRPNRPSRMASPTWCAPRSHRKQPASRSRSGGRTRPVLASKAH